MSVDIHEQARELIALAGVDDLSSEDQAWLQFHLRDCAECRSYEEEAGAVIRALRSEPLIANAALVRMAQRHVRAWVIERQARQERFWLVSLACLLVGVSAAVTTPLFGQIFRWLGIRAGAPDWVWLPGFAFASIVPALLASGVLLVRGSHLAKISRQEGR